MEIVGDIFFCSAKLNLFAVWEYCYCSYKNNLFPKGIKIKPKGFENIGYKKFQVGSSDFLSIF